MLQILLVLLWCSVSTSDVPITWWSTSPASLPCVVADADRIPVRRPPPPLDDEKSRPKIYTWTRNNEELNRILNNGTLEVLKKKNGSAEGVYQCAVRYQAGFVLGYPVHLKFVHLDKQFAVQPNESTAQTGQPFVFTCDVNSGPAASITWLRDGKPLPHNERYHLLTNKLLILDVTREDAGLYKCKATNTYVNKTRTSHGGRLKVKESSNVEAGFLPVHNETDIDVPKGGSVVLACPVVGTPKPALIWTLSQPGKRTQELEIVDEILTLRGVALDDEGVYNCSIVGRSDLVKSFNVQITEPVKIIVPPKSKLAWQASTVRFNCTATGRPTPNVTWYKNGQPLALAGRIAVLQSVESKLMQLLIRSVTSEDAGVYQCFAHGGASGASAASAWAWLNVTGAGAAAPGGVRCGPVGPRSIAVRWDGVNATVLAYTVQITSPEATSFPWKPTLQTEEIISVAEALAAYAFQVRVYLQSKTNPASDMSASVVCQGQGVPIKLAHFGDGVLVSWKQFAHQTPGVKEWILQYKVENSSVEHNITLGEDVYNYTLDVSPKPEQVRVLGTKVLPWLQQNLTLVPWTSTSVAGQSPEDGELTAMPSYVEVTDVGPREFTVRWRCDEADSSPEQYSYMLCTRQLDGNEQMCFETNKMSALVDDLSPNTEYEVRVQARVIARNAWGDFTEPLHISTMSEGPQRFQDLTYKFVNASALRVSWNSMPDKYTVNYSNELELPISQWLMAETMGNTVLLTDLDLSRALYVRVTGYEPVGHSSILRIPVQVPEAKNLDYSYTSSGDLQVTWKGTGTHIVRYSQNLTQSLDLWQTVNVTGNSVLLTGLKEGQTYVMVAAPGLHARSRVLNVPPRPHGQDNSTVYLKRVGVVRERAPVANTLPEQDNTTVYLTVGIICGIFLLILLGIAAVCLWRVIKRSRSPTSARRRNEPPNQGNGVEDAEMTNIGCRLANGGGSKDAGEPLLNGHVHITENPSSKTPNGRTRKARGKTRARYSGALDMARDDAGAPPDALACAPDTAFQLLDTSRMPDYEPERSEPHLSYNKLPDDNMNSELTRSSDFQIDNSKILPTLQPNG